MKFFYASLILCLFAIRAEAKLMPTLSGVLVEIEETQWKEVWLSTPSGVLVKTLQMVVPKAKAAEKTLREVIDDYVDLLSGRLKINAQQVKDVIWCESQYNPEAINPRDVDGHKKWGLLQWYLPTYYGAGGKDWKDWKENLDIGMPMMAKDGFGRWPVCSGTITYEALKRKWK